MYSTQKPDKKFLTKEEFCDFCGISESTGYKLMKNRKVEFLKCREGLMHFYKIPIEEAYRYLQEKELKNKYGLKWEGSLTFEKVVRYLPYIRSAIQVPIYVIGIDV